MPVSLLAGGVVGNGGDAGVGTVAMERDDDAVAVLVALLGKVGEAVRHVVDLGGALVAAAYRGVLEGLGRLATGQGEAGTEDEGGEGEDGLLHGGSFHQGVRRAGVAFPAPSIVRDGVTNPPR